MSEAAVKGKELEIKKGKHYTAANVGKDGFGELQNYTIVIRDAVRRGKVFFKEALDFTGMEISYGELPPGKSVPFIHSHKQDEEAYIFIKGQGRMQIDDDIIDVSEGSIVRVATPGKRCVGNNSEKPLVFICVQAKENSLTQYTVEDGVRHDEPPKV